MGKVVAAQIQTNKVDFESPHLYYHIYLLN